MKDHYIPDRPEDWPCRTEAQDPPPRLVAALYVLMRDHVQPGDLEQVMLQVRHEAENTVFTNPHLEGYARSLATYLESDR